MSLRTEKLFQLLSAIFVFCALFFSIFFFLTRGEDVAIEDVQKAKIQSLMDELEQYTYGISPYWLDRYDITLRSKEDLYLDIDNDGLTLEEEYRYNTDPKNPDTDGDGYNDGKEVRDGYSPIGQGMFDANKNGLPDSWEKEMGLTSDEAIPERDIDGDGLTNAQEFQLGTHPKNPDTDGDGFTDLQEILNGYDPTVAGEVFVEAELHIPKLEVAAPIVFSQNTDETSMLNDLEKGILHYPKTGAPGQIGNSVITGHSSNYAWSKGSYNYIFKDLNELVPGDEFIIKTKQQNGKQFEYTYRVTEKAITSPDDERIFDQTPEPTATLVTCWPLNTNLRRLMVKGELVE